MNILDFTSCENIVIVKPYLVTPVSKSMQILGLPIRVSLAPAEFGVSGLLLRTGAAGSSAWRDGQTKGKIREYDTADYNLQISELDDKRQVEGREPLMHGSLRVSATTEDTTVAVTLSSDEQVKCDGTNY